MMLRQQQEAERPLLQLQRGKDQGKRLVCKVQRNPVIGKQQLQKLYMSIIKPADIPGIR